MTKIDPLRSLRPVAEEALAELVDRAIVPSGRPLAYDVYASNHELVIEFDVPGHRRARARRGRGPHARRQRHP